MNLDPKAILAEFGIDVNGPDPDGQYQWKMLSLKAGSPERQRLEKAWSAFVLGRKAVSVPAPPKAAKVKSTAAEQGWTAKRWLAIALVVIITGVLWLFLHDRKEHPSVAIPPTKEQHTVAVEEWRTKYDAIKTMLDSSTHDDEHHEEFILLAEAAKAAIQAGQGAAMLERINADLAAERAGSGPQRITELEAHKAQWKIILEALVMNKAELLDHEKFKGHHEGEL